MNKYLEKIAAGRMDSTINHILQWGDNLVGHSARRAKNRVNVLKDSVHIGGGIPTSTLNVANRIHRDLARKSLNTRIKTGLTVAGVGTAGYMGIHKYQQHKDNQIMKRILQDADNNQIY